MEKIASFTVNHETLETGLYISRIDGDITTYDLRTRKPNTNDLMDHSTMHSCEHMFATYIRNSEIKEDVIYFGPMGCQTGFYFLVRDNVKPMEALNIILEAIESTIAHTGEVFGASEIECGNYKTLDLDKAKTACIDYLDVLVNTYEVLDYEQVNNK